MIYYHHASHRIQSIYLIFANQDEARKVLINKPYYLHKLEKFDANISALNSSLYKIMERLEHPERWVAIIKPLSSLELVTELPSESFYVKQVAQLIQTVTQLLPGQVRSPKLKTD